MTQVIAADDLDLSRFLKPGDRIVFGQACGEPTTLVEALIAQGAAIGKLRAFIATSFSGLFSFTGEGQNWEKVQTLTRTGNKLKRAEESGTFTYTRCA